MASVRKRDPKDSSSPWVCEYTDADGKRRRYTPKTGLKKDADAYRRKVEAEIERGEHIAKSESLSVAQVAEDFIRHCEHKIRDGRIGNNRHREIKRTIDLYIKPQIGNVLVSVLTPRHVQDLYNAMVNGRLSPPVAKRRIIIAQQIQEYAIDRGWMKARPVTQALRSLRGVEVVPIRTFTPDEVALLLKHAPIRQKGDTARKPAMLACLVHLAAYTGLRYGEIMGLTLDNLDLDGCMVRVRKSLSLYDGLKGPKTKAGIRDVPMPDYLAEMLRAWIAQYHIANEQRLVFTGATGSPCRHPTFTVWMWHPLLKRCGLVHKTRPFHFHALRHYYASWLADHNFPLPVIAQLMGHSKFDVTLQIYAHPIVRQDARDDRIRRLAAGAVGLLPAPSNAT